MDTNDMRIFCEVARCESTIKAADNLGYTQSNISKRISNLEQELGRKLFIRSNIGMVLTYYGELFLDYAERFIKLLAKMERDLSNAPRQLRLGTTQSLSVTCLTESYYDESISIYIQEPFELIKELKNKKLDVIVINRIIEDINIKEIKSIDEHINWAKLKEEPFDFQKDRIVVSRNNSCPYRKASIDYLKQNDIDLSKLIEVDTIEVLLTMLETRKAISMLPVGILRKNPNIAFYEEFVGVDQKVYVYALADTEVPQLDFL